MARRKSKYAESRIECIWSEICWVQARALHRVLCCGISNNPRAAGVGLRVERNRLRWRNKVWNSEYLDFFDEAKWQAGGFSQGMFKSGGNGVFWGLVLIFSAVGLWYFGFFPCFDFLRVSLRAKLLCKEYISIAKIAMSLLQRTGSCCECSDQDENKITCDELKCIFKRRFENISFALSVVLKMLYLKCG